MNGKKLNVDFIKKTLLDNDLIVQDYYNSKIRSQYLTDNVPSLVPPSKGLLVIINAYHQRENPLERVETVVSDFSKNLRKIRWLYSKKMSILC